MRKLLLIPVLFLFACQTKHVKKTVIGKDMSFDKYGSKTYSLYYSDGYENVTGSYYYSAKVGDTITITQFNVGE